jgi:hypothetical protein
MTPVLIDTRSWLKFGFIAVFFAGIIFVGGFFLGYQNATAYYQTDSETLPLSLPEEVVASNGSVEPVMPEMIGEGENIDVDQADSVITLTAIDDVPVADVDETVLMSQENASTALTTDNDITPKSLTGINFTRENVQEGVPENMDKIKYSIQAGVYGRLANAENVMEQLKAEKFDAYVSEYINKSNEVRYNVRLGYFVDKRSALPTLYHFRREKNSEAYLVKFSADAVVDFVYEESAVAGEKVMYKNIDENINVLVNQAKMLSELSDAN